MENAEKHRDIKIVTREKEENIWYQNKIIILLSFSQEICSLEKWENSNTNEQTCLFRTANTRASKTVMDKFWYDYIKPKYGEKAKLC